MICKEFELLTPLEKSNYIGSIAHACMNDADLFLAGQKLIERATRKGLFNQVIINPVEPINNNLKETE